MSYLLTARAPLWFWVFGWLLTLMTVAGNGLVIYLITASQRLHTRTNWFILSLAFADLFFGSIYFPSLFACDFCLSCDENIRIVTAYQLAFISVANLCVMTLDRYVAFSETFALFHHNEFKTYSCLDVRSVDFARFSLPNSPFSMATFNQRAKFTLSTYSVLLGSSSGFGDFTLVCFDFVPQPHLINHSEVFKTTGITYYSVEF